MLFKSALVTQASGSLGGIVASRNRGGMYLRARTIPVDPNTPAQVIIRAAMSLLVVRWNDTLSALQRSQWNTYASLVPLTGPLGDPVITSGINMYVRTNVIRLQGLRTILDAGPFPFNLGTLSAVVMASASVATQLVTFTFDVTDGWNIADGNLNVFISRPQNLSTDFFRGPYQRAGSFNGDDPAVSPGTLTPVTAFTIGQRLFARVSAGYPDGRVTEAQFIGPITTAA